jgi:hypothetical protein
MRVFASIALVLTLAACGQQEGATYPPQYELNFMRACQAQQPAANLCPCTWERITREIPPAEFATFERLPPNEQVAHPLYAEIQRYALECASQSEPAADDPPAP